MNDYKAEQLGDNWLRDNGITQKQFKQAELWQLQAQKTAHNLLKNKTDLLTEREQNTLIDFYWAMQDKGKRKNITKRMTYEVMNIGAKIRRKGFRANKSR